MKMLSQSTSEKKAADKANPTTMVKVRKRKKSLLEYFRCLSCKCRKGNNENNNVFKKRTNNGKPLGIPLDSDDNVRRHVVEIKKARKLSMDSNHVSSVSCPSSFGASNLCQFARFTRESVLGPSQTDSQT